MLMTWTLRVTVMAAKNQVGHHSPSTITESSQVMYVMVDVVLRVLRFSTKSTKPPVASPYFFADGEPVGSVVVSNDSGNTVLVLLGIGYEWFSVH